MLQISIIILFWFSLKSSSLCSILFFSCFWFTSFTSKLLNTFSYNATHKNFPHTPQYRYYAVCWSLTFTASSTVPEVGMSLSCYFSHLIFFLPILLLLPCMIGDLYWKTLQARRNIYYDWLCSIKPSLIWLNFLTRIYHPLSLDYPLKFIIIDYLAS